MHRPAGLFLDTDVLIQLYISRSQNILGHLKTDYGISGLIVPEVAAEISQNKKFGNRFYKDYRRSCTAGWIRVMDVNTYAEIVNSSPDLQECATGVSYSDIEQLGRQYNYRIGRGEAYTHAAAVLLSQPVASNDRSALNVLERNGDQIPVPVLRAFDLFVFAHQTEFKTLSDCKKIRQALLDEDEHLPGQWINSSFGAGLNSFTPRLVDSSLEYAGAENKSNAKDHYSSPLIITKV